MKIHNTKTMSDDRLKILVYGAPGVGKTTLAKTISEPCLIISAEAGLLSLAGSEIDAIDLSTDDEGKLISKEKRIGRLGEVYQYLNTEEAQNKYKWVFVDSLTEIGQNIVEALQIEYPSRSDTMKLWGDYAVKMKALIKSFRDLPHYNVVMTALEKMEKDENGVRFAGISVQGSIGDNLPAYFDECFYMCVIKNESEEKRVLLTSSSDRYKAKDRSGKLDRSEQPNLAAIAAKIKGEKKDA